MVGCFAYGDTALVERFVDGVEIAVSVVDTGSGPTALPAVEIVPDSGSYDYAARYTAGATRFFVPARISDGRRRPGRRDRARGAHPPRACATCPGPTWWSTPTARPWFLEVNVAPGLTETSLLPQAADAAGLELGALYRALVEQARSR